LVVSGLCNHRAAGRLQALSVDESRQVTNRECYSWMSYGRRVLFVDEGGQMQTKRAGYGYHNHPAATEIVRKHPKSSPPLTPAHHLKREKIK
jgi:hypothetical protein